MQTKEQIEREWKLYDLKGKILGRASSEIAQLLIGKNKPTYTPHIDNGDYVVAINAVDIRVTGKKKDQKMYYRHSGYPGGFKSETFREAMEKNPTRIIEKAVKGMLPKNKLQDPRLKRLKVYQGNEHPHANHFTKEKIVKKISK